MGGDFMRTVCKFFIGSLALLFLLGCRVHEHTWTNADCLTPKTCAECGITEGEPLGHDFSEATCDRPKTCLRCGITEGEPLNHTFSEATCTEPRTCLRCGIAEGEPLGHAFTDATCTEPGVCLRCGETIAPPGHDWIETCSLPKTCRRCGVTDGEAPGHRLKDGVCEQCGYTVFEPFSGVGDAVLSDVQTGDAIYRVRFTVREDNDFTVWAFDANGNADLLFLKSGRYEGSVLLFGEAPFTFEIYTRAPWTLTLEQLDQTAADSFFGEGDAVTDLCLLNSGTYRLTHAGEDDFVVWLYTTDGETLVLHRQGACESTETVTVPDGSLAFFAVRADGAWRVERADHE